jgi:imidazoleglycerol-phosphate dehydratase/histidinol-phosphatase
MPTKVLFIDRDGTLIEEPADNQVDALEKVRLVEGVIPALLQLQDVGYRLVMVSNQDGLGTASFPEDAFRRCHDHVLALFGSQGIEFDEIFICPHLPDDGCDCRKPRAGLLTRYLAETSIDLGGSAVIGDRSTDLELAERTSWKPCALRTAAPSWNAIPARRASGSPSTSTRRDRS